MLKLNEDLRDLVCDMLGRVTGPVNMTVAYKGAIAELKGLEVVEVPKDEEKETIAPVTED